MARPQHGVDGEGNPLAGDALLRDLLKAIDEHSGIMVTSWEADFLENVLFRYANGPLSDKQRVTCHRMLWKYTPNIAENHGFPIEPAKKPGPHERRARRRIDTTRSAEKPRTKSPKPW